MDSFEGMRIAGSGVVVSVRSKTGRLLTSLPFLDEGQQSAGQRASRGCKGLHHSVSAGYGVLRFEGLGLCVDGNCLPLSMMPGIVYRDFLAHFAFMQCKQLGSLIEIACSSWPYSLSGGSLLTRSSRAEKARSVLFAFPAASCYTLWRNAQFLQPSERRTRRCPAFLQARRAYLESKCRSELSQASMPCGYATHPSLAGLAR